MQNVGKICCANNGGFVMKFRVKWDGGESGWTDTYPIGQTKCLDLSNFNIPDGAECWPEVHAELGKSKECSDKVAYQTGSGDVATYKVSGTTLDIHCHLEGS
ncbi:MAG TPA: hypothetical protein VLV83_16935 [Acidobacteriota bacterium]|nr:hypothetical protein [Acidobacteriota bacterium]